jgi:hypothetical protein
MGDGSQPPKAPGWHFLLAYCVCTAIAIATSEVVGEAVRPYLSFWPTFAVKIAAASAAALIAVLVWQWIAGRWRD